MSLPTVYYLDDSLMSSSISKGRGGRKKKGAYKMPTKIPAGDVLVDSSKKQWVIQSSIGRGGFGEIYTATTINNKAQQNFVIKIEPSENGPLFCEKTVYIRIGKQEDVKEYMKSRNLKSLGMPTFFGSGVHSVNGKKFRFLVMERYGKDLWSIFLENNRIFPPAAVFKVATQVLDVLEYIHSRGYVHADIKGANLLLGQSKGQENQVFLVDFGLAARYTNQYKADPRRAHNGTIEYTSRDGHEGIVTRRGDIEILGFNLVQWLSSNLPWEGLKDLHEVQARKIKYMKDIKLLLSSCFKSKTIPITIEKYLDYVVNMDPLEEPDYKKLTQILKEGIAKTGDKSPKLDFHMEKKDVKSKGKGQSSPVPAKVRKGNDGRKLRRPVVTKSNKTIDVSECSDDDDDDDDEEEEEEEEEEDDDEDFIESTPEKKKSVKRSWKDCPSVVSCAALLLKDEKSVRRCRKNK